MEKVETIGKDVERDKGLFIACYKTLFTVGWLTVGGFFHTKEEAFAYGDRISATKVIVITVDEALFL